MTITLEALLPETVAGCAAAIRKAAKKRLADVTLFDLILGPEKPHPHHHGAYLVFSPGGDQLLYVGRVQGPQFIERLPAHFALGEGSWQNQFLKHHRNRTSAVSLANAAFGAGNCELLLVLSPPEHAAKLEALLIRAMLPAYNVSQPKSGLPSSISPDLTLQVILKHEALPLA